MSCAEAIFQRMAAVVGAINSGLRPTCGNLVHSFWRIVVIDVTTMRRSSHDFEAIQPKGQASTSDPEDVRCETAADCLTAFGFPNQMVLVSPCTFNVNASWSEFSPFAECDK